MRLRLRLACSLAVLGSGLVTAARCAPPPPPPPPPPPAPAPPPPPPPPPPAACRAARPPPACAAACRQTAAGPPSGAALVAWAGGACVGDKRGGGRRGGYMGASPARPGPDGANACGRGWCGGCWTARTAYRARRCARPSSTWWATAGHELFFNFITFFPGCE